LVANHLTKPRLQDFFRRLSLVLLYTTALATDSAHIRLWNYCIC